MCSISCGHFATIRYPGSSCGKGGRGVAPTIGFPNISPYLKPIIYCRPCPTPIDSAGCSKTAYNRMRYRSWSWRNRSRSWRNRSRGWRNRSRGWWNRRISRIIWWGRFGRIRSAAKVVTTGRSSLGNISTIRILNRRFAISSFGAI